MADMIEQKISDPEPWTNKILCRYREAPPIKQFLREGEDRVLVAEITRLRQLLSEAEKREREARVKALEEAALWHDAKVQEYTDQIAVNDAYIARGGLLKHESRANEYCDDIRSCHRRAAAAFRALQSEER
ncbi:hypothetical protein [Agrobacterium pusense]|uniref:hypothetical protein n=1 Tax=Agrobacterium pusense TaxID=648995 RepID=UPI000D19967C|nr:hypothetical protein [Agrobacterium pusense]